jgi:hypothetical protein
MIISRNHARRPRRCRSSRAGRVGGEVLAAQAALEDAEVGLVDVVVVVEVGRLAERRAAVLDARAGCAGLEQIGIGRIHVAIARVGVRVPSVIRNRRQLAVEFPR